MLTPSAYVNVAFCLITSPLAPVTMIVTSSPAWFASIVTLIWPCSFTATVSESTVNSPLVEYTSNEVLFSLCLYLSLVRYVAVTVYVPTAGLSICNIPSPSFTYTVYVLTVPAPDTVTVTLPVTSAGAFIVMLTSLPLAIIPLSDTVKLMLESTLLTLIDWVALMLERY